MAGFSDRLKHAFDVFRDRDPDVYVHKDLGSSYYRNPDKPFFTMGSERTIITSIYTRIGIDVASVNMQHVRLDENDRFLEEIDSGLDRCLAIEANIDQSGRQFIQDVVLSMLDEGYVAIVPVDTDINIDNSNSFDILSMRTGKIVEWYPKHVKLRVYNENIGQKQDIVMPKDKVAIVENPLYSVMNAPNSTLRRLIHKLALLDAVDEMTASGKLDMIIQLPYVIKTEARQREAEKRRRNIEDQLSGNNKYGIAYIDGTEKVTQLNRTLDNNLMSQIEYLHKMLYAQLGITEEVMNGTANEATMLNYWNRVVEPILAALSDAMKRTFLTKTARSQRQTIMYFRDPFKLAPISQIAEIADKFTRNEILSSNEVRGIIGFKPSPEPNADALRNKNIAPSEEQLAAEGGLSLTNPSADPTSPSLPGGNLANPDQY